MRRRPFTKVIIFVIILVFCFSVISTPVFAWKVKTHVYSANLILEEVMENGGYVEIQPFGKFQVIPEFYEAIRDYPEYYRAGAMGMDVMPDILVGQTVLHPGKVYTSGEFVEMLWDKAKSLPEKYPDALTSGFLGNLIELTTRKQAMAFILGFAAHAAGDFFGHSYINHWSGGEWPEMADGLTPEETKIIIRHNAVEGYIDEKIPDRYKETSYNTIKTPVIFILNTMITNGLRYGTDKMKDDQRDISPIFGSSKDHPMHFKVFFDIRRTLKKRVIDLEEKGIIGKIIGNLITLDFAQKAYMEAWIKDIDTGLYDWASTNGRVAQYMLQESGMRKAKEEISGWSERNLLKMLGAPDVAANIINKIGDIIAFAEGLIPDELNKYIQDLKTNFYNAIFIAAFGVDMDTIINTWTNPEHYLNQTSLFPEGAVARLNEEMGNFNASTNPLDQTFIPFSNSLVLIKTTLIGYPGLMELRRRAGSNSTFQPPQDVDMTIINVRNMDYGYNWDTPYEGGDLLFGNSEDYNKVAQAIFNLNGTNNQNETNNETKNETKFQLITIRDRLKLRPGALTKGIPAYSNASSWAVPELEKGAVYGLITEKIKDNMSTAITREEFAEIAVRVYEKYFGTMAAYGDMSAFVDTRNPEIFKAFYLGIVNGTDLQKKLFSPNELTNREQVAAMLFRTVNAIKPDEDTSTTGVGRFADDANISRWALEPVKFMNKHGFILGTDGYFNPKNNCTRQEAVLIAVRLFEKYAANAANSSSGTNSDGSNAGGDGGLIVPGGLTPDIPILPKPPIKLP